MSEQEDAARKVLDLSKQREKANTYKASLSCFNCGQGFECAIVKGISVREFNPVCPNCGCKLNDVNR